MSDTPRRNSQLCPNCRKLVSKDETVCPYCGIAAPAAWYRNLPIMKVFSFADPVQAVFTVTIVWYVLSLIVHPSASSFRLSLFSFLAPSSNSLFDLGASGSLPVFNYRAWWTTLTANYLHGGLLHIFFNLSALRQIGPLVADEYGKHRFFVLYTLTGVFGFVVSAFAGVAFTIGASASVCGLIGAMLYYGKRRGGHWGEMVYRQTTSWIVGLVVFGFLFPGINNWAHGGGLLAGVALGWGLGYNERRRPLFWHRALAALCLVATAAALLWGLYRALFMFR